MVDETSQHRLHPAARSPSHWIVHYDRQWLTADVIAGLTVSAVVIPKALAYATVAGLPVQVGLYTAFLPMAIYALLGVSRTLSVSTTATLAILTATALSEVVPSGEAAALITATATLALMVGCILAAASLFRLGFVANFISEPVLVGFKAGIAIVIVVDQIPKLLGLHFPKSPFLHSVWSIVAGLPHASLLTLLVAAVTAAVLIALERFVPRVPAPLVAVAAGIAGVAWLGLTAHGVQTVGTVPTGLPTITMPAMSMISTLWPAALGIALMSFTETIAAGRAFVQEGERPPNANRELLATGIGNIGGAFMGAMPAGGGTSQTAVNREAGAHSQAAGLVTAVVALAAMLLLAPVIGLMPQATLAAIVIVYSIGLIQPAEFIAILKVRRTEFVWAVVAMVGVVLLGTLEGILVAIVVSMVALAHQLSDPPVHVLVRKPGTNIFRPTTDMHPEDESFPGLLLLRPEGRIFFANAEHLGQKVRALIESTAPQWVVLDLAGVFDIEYTALKMLNAAEKQLRDMGVLLCIVGLTPQVLAMVKRSPLGATLGEDRMFYTLEEVVARYHTTP